MVRKGTPTGSKTFLVISL